MSRITIFSSPKPFSDPHINIIQRNAIQSWKELGPQVDVVLVGDEPGLMETALDLGVRQVPGVDKNKLGTPLVDSIFKVAREAIDNEIQIYINADIILFPEFLQVINNIYQEKKEFLLVGRRWDLDITSKIDFEGKWVYELEQKVRNQGKLHDHTALDYFVFPRHLFQEIPPFAIGRAGWDNWMVYQALKKNWTVIDITPSIIVIHQGHDYDHLPEGKPHYDLDESSQNVNLGGGFTKIFDLLDVNWEFRNGRIRKIRLTLPRMLRKIERSVIPQRKKGWRWWLTRKLRQLRRKVS